jgi:hypothetical protein
MASFQRSAVPSSWMISRNLTPLSASSTIAAPLICISHQSQPAPAVAPRGDVSPASWADYYRRHFQIGSVIYGAARPEECDVQNVRKIKLSSLAVDGEDVSDCVYEYGRCPVCAGRQRFDDPRFRSRAN